MKSKSFIILGQIKHQKFNMMKNIIILILSLPLVLTSNLLSQDYILKLNQGIKTFHVTDLKINEGIVSYKNDSSEFESSVSIDDVININFFEDKPDEINILSFSIDTIKCKIDSISSYKILYRTESNILQSANKADIFNIQFDYFSSNPDFNTYKNSFIKLHKNRYVKNLKLIKKDNSKLEISKLISIQDSKLEFIILMNGVEIKTSATEDKIHSFINMEPINRANFYSDKVYLLTKQKNFKKVEINSISNDKLNVKMFVNNDYINIDQNKSTIDGLFFYDINSQNIEAKPQLQTYNNELVKNKVRFGFNAGFGYLIAPAPKDASSDQKEYIDELRAGFAFEANIDIFPTNNFGFGVKYNQFNTSNTYETIKDNIKVTFIGASFVSFTQLTNNIGYLYSSFSVGSLSEVNNGEFQGADIKLEGSTVGFYLALGLDFNISQNFTIGLQSGLMAGKIKEMEINGQNVELEEPESLARLDGMIGMKIYF